MPPGHSYTKLWCNMKSKPLTYLACPYTSSSSLIRHMRYHWVNKAFAHLMETKGWNVFSPITHSHPVHELGLAGDWTFWKRIDTEYLSFSKRLVVLQLEGWDTSVGVQAEIKIAKRMKVPILYMSPITRRLSKKP